MKPLHGKVAVVAGASVALVVRGERACVLEQDMEAASPVPADAAAVTLTPWR